jgi:hypothetical protein
MSLNPASEDIKDLLDAETNLGVTFGDSLFIGEIAETATRPAIGVYDIPGPERDLAVDIEHPNVQVRVEGQPGGYIEAHELLQTALTIVHGQHNITQGGARYLVIQVVSEIMFVHYDERQRPVFSAHLRTMRTTA